MARIPSFSIIAMVAFGLPLVAACNAQTNAAGIPYQITPIPSNTSSSPYNTTILPPPVEASGPFALDASAAPGVEMVTYLSADRMAASDRDLATYQEPAIREAATLAGMELNNGVWSQQQIVCQALPQHLFLLYTGDNGRGDISRFTVAITRSGNHHVRVTPIERRGFTLYHPAPVDPLVITAFNRIRTAEPSSKSVDWFATALCYAALTGAKPRTTNATDRDSDSHLALSFAPTLEVGALGDATVRFIDVTATPQPMQWVLTFDSTGRLLHVDTFASPAYTVTALPQAAKQQSSSSAKK